MKLRLIPIFALLLCSLLVTINSVKANPSPSILIEFLYFEPCSVCPEWEIYYQVYEHNSMVICNIERDYGSTVQVQRIQWASQDGVENRRVYNLGPYDWNTIIVNRAVVLKGGKQFVDEVQLRQIIDYYLTQKHGVVICNVELNSRSVLKGEILNVNVTIKSEANHYQLFKITISLNSTIIEERSFEPPESGSEKIISFHINTTEIREGCYTLIVCTFPFEGEENTNKNSYNAGIVEIRTRTNNPYYFLGHIFFAFVFGFFETFSPCLLVLLSFLISYTLGETIGFKESLTKILIFGTGFLSAALLTSALAFFLFFSLTPFQKVMTLVVSLLAILFGLNAINISLTRFFKKQQETKAKIIIQKMARQYSKKYLGMAMIGFTFYFLDPCIAPVFFTLIPLILNIDFTTIILAFCLGVMSPFLLIGMITGSLSKLVRFSYKHRSKLRLISGLILICYSVYLVFFTIIL